ncbi:MAG TPA: ABC transporter permease [Acidobacteriota bacterium]
MSWFEGLFGNRRRRARRSAGDPAVRETVAREIDEEIGFHLRMRAEDNRRAGMDPESAEREAERRFGDIDRISRASRFQRLAPPDPGGRGSWAKRLAALLDALRRDALYTLRGFARSPGLFVAAIVTLAIGLGATTSIYSLANWVLLRPVPGVEDPEQLSDVWVGRYNDDEGSFRVSRLSYANYHDVADRLTTVTGLAGYQHTGFSVASRQGDATGLSGAAVTASYFDVLGVDARLGRTISPDDDDPANGAEIVVISHRLWTTMFNRDPEVLGKTLRLNGLVFSIIGVGPEGFHGTELGGDLDVWIPGASYARARHFDDPARYAGRENGMFSTLVARKSPEATWEQVDAELDSMEEWLATEFPEANESFREVGFTVFGSFGTEPLGRDHLARTLSLLLGVSALVLLIACANVANLLLIRGLGRQAEVSLRKALGAGRLRLLAQHLTEGAVLWLLGGALGVAVAYGLSRFFEGARVGYATVAGIAMDGRVIGFATSTALIVGVAFALFPAVTALRAAPAGVLKEGGPAGGRRTVGVRSVLTVLQLAASLTLLIGTLLLVQTLRNLSAVDTGIDAENVYAVGGSTNALGYSQEQTYDYFREFERRLQLHPGVASVAVATRVPFRCCGSGTRIRPAGDTAGERQLEPGSNMLFSPDYFEVLGIPLLSGRSFEIGDMRSPGREGRPVVVLSESLAQRLFPAAEAVGRMVEFPFGSREDRQFEVIGVVGDVHFGDLTAPPEPVVYEPAGLDGSYFPQQYVVVRLDASIDVAAVTRDIGAQLDAALPVGTIMSMEEALAGARAQWTLLAKLMSLLAVVAATLAAVGLHGVVAFGVKARAREIGIRMALGAESARVFRLVLRSTLGMTIAGLVFGLGGAVALARVLESRLFGVAPFDVGTWTLAAAGLVAIALLASWLPARRATRVDPVETLRSL